MSTAPPFSFSFELTTQDVVDYLRVAQKTVNNVGIGAGIIGVLYGISLGYLGDVALGIVLIVMAVFLLLASATSYMDRLRARSVGKRIVGTRASYTIDEGGIDSTTVAGQRHVPWSDADNVLEGSAVIIVRRARTTIAWLPKRAMGSPAERDALLEFIRAQVGPQAG
jgi:hypothetical protein